MVDQSGDFVLDTDQDNLMDRYHEVVAESGPEASRVLHFELSMPLPKNVATVIEAAIGNEKATDGNMIVAIA